MSRGRGLNALIAVWCVLTLTGASPLSVARGQEAADPGAADTALEQITTAAADALADSGVSVEAVVSQVGDLLGAAMTDAGGDVSSGDDPESTLEVTPDAESAEAVEPTAEPLSDDLAGSESADTPSGGDGIVQATRPGAFMVNFQNTDLRLALRLLSTQGRRNIVASKSVSGTVTATFYDVTFEEALDAILKATGFVFHEADNFIYIYTVDELEKIQNAGQELTVQWFRLSYITATDAQVLIAPALSSAGTVAITPEPERGIGADITQAGGNDYATEDVLVVKDYPENIQAVADVLREIDIRPPQVLIEATILSARLDETNSLGVNFAALTGDLNFEDIGSGSTGVGNMATGSVPAANVSGTRGAAIRTDFKTIDNGMSIGILTSTVASYISALEVITDLTVLANPKLLVVNKQRGEVLIGSRDGYRTTVVSEGISQENIEFLETGTKLIVRPFVANDGYIRMELHPEDSDGSVTDGLPSETTTQVTSNVLIRDGRTIVVGGLFREEVQNTRNQIPWFGNIKHLGPLFGRSDDVTERREVIIVITPHVIRHEVDEAVGEQLIDEIERFRLGQRKGLRWWGRNRLAQGDLRDARQALRMGDLDKAQWHLDSALALDPRFVEAIDLKEQLTEEAYWADEGRVSSIKYTIKRMMMEELNLPPERVIPSRKPLDAKGLGEDVRDSFDIRPRTRDPLDVEVGRIPQDTSTPEVKTTPKQTDDNDGVLRLSPSALPEQVN